jgi:putative endonuclease
MFPKKPTEKQIVGRVGENFACEYLKKLGYKIIDRNYLKKWGEIDIVAKKGNNIHFLEVKTVTRVTNSDYRPEDNVHSWKLQRLGRVIQSYLLDKDISDNIEWQFDVVTVYLDADKGLVKIEIIDNLVL